MKSKSKIQEEFFAERLRRLRTERALSLAAAGRRAWPDQHSNHTRQRWYRLESSSRTPQLDTLFRVKAALGCSWDDLLEGLAEQVATQGILAASAPNGLDP